MSSLARSLAALVFMAITMLAGPARADELRPGYIEFTQQDAQNWRLVWKAPMRGVTPATQPVLPSGCAPAGEPVRELSAQSLVTTSSVRCTKPVAGQSIGLSNFATSQTDVLVRVAPLGEPMQALRLTPAQPMAEIATKPSRWQVAETYFVTGVEHIVFGYDHLLFVVALVLLLDGFWRIAKAVTAFTIAHSITLAGATLGLVGLPQRPVESVIALSIIFLAVEIAKKEPGRPRLSERLPWLVSFAFGLLHGFGFAGALNEIGLPQDDVPLALLMFNLGVEAGQIVIVLAAVALILLMRRFAAPALAPMLRLATYATGSLASFWFIERTFT